MEFWLGSLLENSHFDQEWDGRKTFEMDLGETGYEDKRYTEFTQDHVQ
jgi:hypothetical protein